MTAMPVIPFSIPFSQLAVDDLRDRLRRTRWLDEIPGSASTYGVDRQFLRDICEYVVGLGRLQSYFFWNRAHV